MALRSDSTEVRLRVRLTPRSSADALIGWNEGLLRARVTAPPIDGRANAALTNLIARSLGVPRSSVGIVGGATARDKTVAVAGLTYDEAAARLQAAINR
jgi:uncharacterized protein (TIGR00251 family)